MRAKLKKININLPKEIKLSLMAFESADE